MQPSLVHKEIAEPLTDMPGYTTILSSVTALEGGDGEAVGLLALDRVTETFCLAHVVPQNGAGGGWLVKQYAGYLRKLRHHGH